MPRRPPRGSRTLTSLPPLDFNNCLDWAEEIHLLYRRWDPRKPDTRAAPARIRVWSVIVDDEVYVRSPRGGTADAWFRDVFGRTIAVVDGQRMRVLCHPCWEYMDEEMEGMINGAFAHKYAHVPAFGTRISRPQARAATVCLRALDDDRPAILMLLGWRVEEGPQPSRATAGWFASRMRSLLRWAG